MRSKGLSRVRLMSDHGGQALWDQEGGTTAEDLGLSAKLAEDIAVWQELFDRWVDPEQGWTLGQAEARYYAAANDLAQRLAAELAGRFEVELVLTKAGVQESTVFVER